MYGVRVDGECELSDVAKWSIFHAEQGLCVLGQLCFWDCDFRVGIFSYLDFMIYKFIISNQALTKSIFVVSSGIGLTNPIIITSESTQISRFDNPSLNYKQFCLFLSNRVNFQHLKSFVPNLNPIKQLSQK
jgi:hypothetical protein